MSVLVFAALVNTLVFLMLFCEGEQVCEVANIQIENEDGVRQVFELKSVKPSQSGAYVLCATRQGASSVNGESWSPFALRFNVVLSPGEMLMACETGREHLPVGLCSQNRATSEGQRTCTSDGTCLTMDGHDVSQEDLADEIINRKLLPLATGKVEIDHRIAHSIVSINAGFQDEAIQELSELLKEDPSIVAAYYVRGVAYARKGLETPQHALRSLADFTICIEQEPSRPEGYEWRAEVYIALNQFQDALEDLKNAIAIRPTSRLYFNRGIINLLLENFADAEADLKKNLEEKDSDKNPIYILSYFHLGLAQYYRGRLRNAIEVFKEVLKLDPTHAEACISLAHAFRELGNQRAALSRFDQLLAVSPNHTLALQLKGSLLYYSGDPALARPVLQHCLTVDTDNVGCRYLMALSNTALGTFYQGIKDTTKVMVNSLPMLRSSPEHVRAHYLREYARYLHASLDLPLEHFKPEVSLDEDLRSQWVQGVPFKAHGTYREQPGLQPDISDVASNPEKNWSHPAMQNLLCFAEKVGWSMQVTSDGFLPNRRLNLAMGLAAVHIAQIAEAKWKNFKSGRSGERPFTWKELFSIAIRYRQLVDPEQAVLWVSSLPDYYTSDGYRADVTFIRGSVTNVRLNQYFDLAFRLARTMLEHFSGEGTVSYAGQAADIQKAKTCEDLLAVARKRRINPHGFLVSTQVPAVVTVPGSQGTMEDRLDGTVLVLTEDPGGRIVFALSLASTPARTNAYAAQMDHFLLQLHQEVQRGGLGKISDLDPILSSILSLVYYFYNLMPLTRGSSVVAYAVMLGLVMSLGRQVSSKLPTGKLLDMEAILSGAPDAFVLVTRQWMSIKKLTTPVSALPRIWEVLPNVRDILELLATNTTAICG